VSTLKHEDRIRFDQRAARESRNADAARAGYGFSKYRAMISLTRAKCDKSVR